MCFFFFSSRRRHTRYWRDWSSDVCSSDLMTQSSNRIFDELARFATDAAGAAQGVRREIETVVRTQLERLVKDMDVATREEGEVLRAMGGAAREGNERVEGRGKDLGSPLAPPRS